MIRCTRAILCIVMAGASLLSGEAIPAPVTLRVANQAMERWPDGRIGPKGSPAVWGFELGIVLAGVDRGRSPDHPPAGARRRDLQHMEACGSKTQNPTYRAGAVTADMKWERITYFLDRVIPVASE